MTKKLTSFVLALMMCLAMVVSASAASTTYDVGNGITVEHLEEQPVMPRIWSFWDDCTRNTYFNSFYIYEVNGNRMTLTINNNGNSPVVVNLTVSGTAIPALTVPGHSSDSFKISGNPALSADVNISIFTTDGSNMNVGIRGWQYQEN